MIQLPITISQKTKNPNLAIVIYVKFNAFMTIIVLCINER